MPYATLYDKRWTFPVCPKMNFFILKTKIQKKKEKIITYYSCDLYNNLTFQFTQTSVLTNNKFMTLLKECTIWRQKKSTEFCLYCN